MVMPQAPVLTRCSTRPKPRPPEHQRSHDREHGSRKLMPAVLHEDAAEETGRAAREPIVLGEVVRKGGWMRVLHLFHHEDRWDDRDQDVQG